MRQRRTTQAGAPEQILLHPNPIRTYCAVPLGSARLGNIQQHTHVCAQLAARLTRANPFLCPVHRGHLGAACCKAGHTRLQVVFPSWCASRCSIPSGSACLGNNTKANPHGCPLNNAHVGAAQQAASQGYRSAPVPSAWLLCPDIHKKSLCWFATCLKLIRSGPDCSPYPLQAPIPGCDAVGRHKASVTAKTPQLQSRPASSLMLKRLGPMGSPLPGTKCSMLPG